MVSGMYGKSLFPMLQHTLFDVQFILLRLKSSSLRHCSPMLGSRAKQRNHTLHDNRNSTPSGHDRHLFISSVYRTWVFSLNSKQRHSDKPVSLIKQQTNQTIHQPPSFFPRKLGVRFISVYFFFCLSRVPRLAFSIMNQCNVLFDSEVIKHL